MNVQHTWMLAGQLDDLGDSWIGMFQGWATKGLQAGLIVIVVVVMVQKFSLKAGIGALLLLVIALGLYNSREDLARMFEDEVKNPAKSAPVPSTVGEPADFVSRAGGMFEGGWR